MRLKLVTIVIQLTLDFSIPKYNEVYREIGLCNLSHVTYLSIMGYAQRILRVLPAHAGFAGSVIL